MVKNVIPLIMLLGAIAFLVYNCSTSRLEKYDPSQRYGTKALPKSKDLGIRESIAQHAKRLVGAPYVYAGNSPKGFDCSGFTCYVLKDYDINLPRSSRAQAEVGKKIDFAKAKPGDLIFFSKNGKGSISHVAIVVDNSMEGVEVAHSTSSRGVIIENITQSRYWRPKIKYAIDIISPD